MKKNTSKKFEFKKKFIEHCIESKLPENFEWVLAEPTKERWSRMVRMMEDLDSKK
ncbi:MAG: hypothetical protein SVO01_07585 [Thermotogota bacterium]|nr:hypothetical protein [Thermotogota bacterium]